MDQSPGVAETQVSGSDLSVEGLGESSLFTFIFDNIHNILDHISLVIGSRPIFVFSFEELFGVFKGGLKNSPWVTWVIY